MIEIDESQIDAMITTMAENGDVSSMIVGREVDECLASDIEHVLVCLANGKEVSPAVLHSIAGFLREDDEVRELAEREIVENM